MCGFSGIFNLDGDNINIETLIKMSDSIAHRGPDDDGIHIKENYGIAHRRLSILDTSEKGKQPMFSKNKKWCVAFNGCIYNYKEIRSELISKGYSFCSNSDTEVITEGLNEYGLSIVNKFNGMFAIAAFNIEENALYLIRDRYGIKPLYYYFNGKSIIFASEIKAILKNPQYKTKINPSAVNEYFTFQNLFSYQSFFADIKMLPPANITKIDRNTNFIKHNSYWDFDFTKPDYKISYEDALEETERLFKQAVQRQMISDVPVGSYLSGGMDSGSITAIASNEIENLKTFTCGFDLSKVTGREANFDERRDAELMSAFFQTEHYEQVLNANDIRWALPKVVYHLEDLRVGMSYPNFYISRLASKFVKVCLQGTGGDELFAGYPWRYYSIAHTTNKEEYIKEYYNYWQRLVSDKDKKLLFNKDFYNKIDVNEPFEIFSRVFNFNNKLRFNTPEEQIQNSLYFEIKTFLSGLLTVGDKLAMANGLEERFPFLDNDLVDFAMKIPIKYKLGNFESINKKINENQFQKRKEYQEYDDGKKILRNAMSDILPESIVNRKKQGFSSPDENWYRNESYDYIKEVLLSGNLHSSNIIDPKFIEKIVKEHVNGRKNNRLLIWSFLNFEIWCKTFLS